MIVPKQSSGIHQLPSIILALLGVLLLFCNAPGEQGGPSSCPPQCLSRSGGTSAMGRDPAFPRRLATGRAEYGDAPSRNVACRHRHLAGPLHEVNRFEKSPIDAPARYGIWTTTPLITSCFYNEICRTAVSADIGEAGLCLRAHARVPQGSALVTPRLPAARCLSRITP